MTRRRSDARRRRWTAGGRSCLRRDVRRGPGAQE
uniref:Uncharacterized protein n=1 Tax=Siphoviridae sp. ctBLh2 TaxID=2827803 RepID=A0A8S5S474_9CAUD|nr:MAG TPA: hypothetical protein [Siphoviridae sp. ctBLh2]